MQTKVGGSSFEAILKSKSGEVLAQGRASVHLSQKSVNFESDFVPLYPFGTPLEVVRMAKDKEIHRFIGKVYISDKQLMRIVSVNDELLPGSEYVYCDNMSFFAKLSELPPEHEGNFLERLRFKTPLAIKEYLVYIIEVTDRQMVFQFDINELFETGEFFVINAEPPLPIQKTEIEIIKTFYFGDNATYICDFINQSDEEVEALRKFLWEYNLEHNKLF